jgi:hypothetical protein
VDSGGSLPVVAKARSNKKKSGGRRANYAPATTEIGGRKYLPVGWANWLGFVMFSLLTIAVFAETIAAIAQTRGADPIAAAGMTVILGVMTYLFATTRVKD